MNFNIAIDNSGFKPFDLDTVYKALDFYNKGYDKNKEVYDKISLTLGELSTAVEGTEKAKNIYDAYRSLFDTAADSFALGMTTENSRLLGKLRSLYGTDVMKLEEARKAMKAVADTRSKLAATGKANDMLYLSIGNLDNYLDNPNYSPKAYDGNLITANVAAVMDKIKQGLVTISKGEALDPYTDTYSLLLGVDAALAATIMLQLLAGQPVTSIPIVGDAVTRVLNTAGYNDWMDEATKKRARDYALTGVYGLLGQKSIKTKENPEGTAALQDKYKAKDEARLFQYDIAKMQEEAIIKAAMAANEAGTKADNSGEVLVPRDIISLEEYNSNLSDLDANWKTYFTSKYAKGTSLLPQQYWDALVMDDKTLKKYIMHMDPLEGTDLWYYREGFRTWLDKIAPDWKKHATGPGTLRNYVALLIQKYKTGNTPMAGVDTELVYNIKNADLADAKAIILGSSTGAMPVKWDSKSRSYKDDARENTASNELFPEGSTIAGVTISDKGIVFTVNTTNDGLKTYRLPKNINLVEIGAIELLLLKRKKVLDMGAKVDKLGNVTLNKELLAFIKLLHPNFTGNTITKNFLDELNRIITRAMGTHVTNIFVTNSPQAQKNSYTDY